MYGKLEDIDENSQKLYLRATPKTGYTEVTKHSTMNSFIISNNFDVSKLKIIDIEEPIAPKSGYFMFQGCNKLENIENIKNLHTERMNSLMAMFEGCNSLKELDLSNFDTKNVKSTEYMFNGCISVQSLNLDNFDTSKVTNMRMMFQDCINIKKLDLTGFNTGKVTAMWNMFYGCSLLSEINLSSFDTSLCSNMVNMFRECRKLKTIYVSNNFVTTSVTNSTNMFSGTPLLVGGAETHSTGGDATYAHIDGGQDDPGYFTLK